MSSGSESSSPSALNIRRTQERDDRFIVSLVMAVEENPILYDHNHSHYRNPEKKVETWSMLKDMLKYVGEWFSYKNRQVVYWK